ncbi:hypothetical protein AB0B12_12520 [Streptomyces sp. NPDC044780]|uniref:hypothetical protein n=1 Tax=unclassified Streptomyces TaxID=2593676 RepID=UPI00341191FA
MSSQLLDQVAKITQITFWVSTSIIAAMTYANAKKTVFQPLKTEIFKKQLEALEEVLKLFTGKNEMSLRDDFDFELLRHANITKMYDAYILHAFNRQRPVEELEYRSELCPTMIISIDHLEGNFKLVDDHIAPPREDFNASSAKRRGWSYPAAETSLPVAYESMCDRIRTSLEDPFLPSEIAHALEDYLELARSNALKISEIIATMSDQMPRRYPSLMDLTDARTEWIENQVHENFDDLRPSAENIIKLAREYFKSDELLPGQSRKSRKR